jgi:dihydroorotate dehydrogenase electron transfer subunit
MSIEDAVILAHEELSGAYRRLDMESPVVASSVKPGQFIHLRVPRLENAVLRRPFSIFCSEDRTISILYKRIGRGTAAMTELGVGEKVNIMGPLGNGFPVDHDNTFPVLIAGGYGVAPLYFLAERLQRKGVLFVGGAVSDDILCVDDFKGLGWDVRIATEDGSSGEKGLVTQVLDLWLAEHGSEQNPEFYACGPDGMLKAVGQRSESSGCNAWLSLDKHMGCGMGACLACVQKIRKNGKEELARVCKDGPVFEAKEIVWE